MCAGAEHHSIANRQRPIAAVRGAPNMVGRGRIGSKVGIEKKKTKEINYVSKGDNKVARKTEISIRRQDHKIWPQASKQASKRSQNTHRRMVGSGSFPSAPALYFSSVPFTRTCALGCAGATNNTPMLSSPGGLCMVKIAVSGVTPMPAT